MNPSFVPQAREWSCTHPETRRLRVGQSELPLPNEGVTAMPTSGAGSAFLRCAVREAPGEPVFRSMERLVPPHFAQ